MKSSRYNNKSQHNGLHGFTLIELLVVISIIALLVAILMPALNKAKETAHKVTCLMNIKNLSQAWMIYATANDDKLVSGQVSDDGATVEEEDWVHPAIISAGTDNYTREVEGIKRGALYKYLNTPDVYNCPSDKTWRNITATITVLQSPFRSYTISDAMNGKYHSNHQYTKTTLIKSPAEKMIFLEEEEDGLGGNWGSWTLPKDTTRFTWWDPIAVWHGRSTNIGFADGHSEAHQWVDESTIEMSKNQVMGKDPADDGEEDDLNFARRAYHHDYY